MAKSKTNGETKPVLADVLALYSTPVEGATTVAAMFAKAGDAMAIGHRTFSNVPFPILYSEGDAMTAAQAKFLSAQVIRNSLGNEDYDSVDAAAAVTLRDIPAQYSLLSDALDKVCQIVIEANGGAILRRVDRESYVSQLLAANPADGIKGLKGSIGQAVGEALSDLITATKAVKGKATEAGKVDMGALMISASTAPDAG